ncbi:MAG: zinc ribbon domain-containing protein [Syntrophobacterales bacterium]|nr:MAG: zinc ribbon domain-containing protein [Syntrophobacterales bacterium]
MPIYEYQCRKCNKKFEIFQGMADGEVKTCKFCDGSVDKLISLSSFQLKGSGWYVTDYGGKKPSGNEAPISTSGDAGDAPASTGKAVSAPDPKPSSKKDE